MECKNCNNVYEGSFCPNCGQSSGETRLNINFFIDQFNKKYNPLKSHKSIFSFLKSPITYIDNYINCKRVNVVDPITLLFVSVGLFLLISGFINPFQHLLLQFLHKFRLPNFSRIASKAVNVSSISAMYVKLLESFAIKSFLLELLDKPQLTRKYHNFL
jgi:hypothetical protein